MSNKQKQWGAIIVMIALFAMIAFVTNLCSPMAVIVKNQFGASNHESQIGNYGNFFAQNCFMGASGTLLIVSTLNEQGYAVDALQIAGQSVPIAIISVVVGVAYALLFDVMMKRKYAARKGGK